MHSGKLDTPRADTPWKALAAVNIAAIIFGTTGLFGKLDVSPVWITAGRGGFAALTLLVLGILWRASFRIHRSFWTRLVATGILLALHWLTFFISVQMAGVAVATLTFATFPLFTVVIDAFARRRMPGLIEIGEGLAIVIAVALLVGTGLPDTITAQEGAIIGLGSAVSFALFSIGSQRLGVKVNAVALSFYQYVVVVLFLLCALPFADRAPSGAGWAIIAVLGTLATAFIHQLYFYGLRHLPASVCGGFVALEPVYAIVFAALLFNEPIGFGVVFSGALIIGASLLLLRRSRTPAAL